MTNPHEIKEGDTAITWFRLDTLLCKVLGLIHSALGLVVLLGGSKRFPEPSYTALLTATDSNVLPYGIAWLAGGLAVMLGHRRAIVWTGLVINTLIANLWAALFAVAAFTFDNAALTASVAYGGFGLLNALLLGFMIVHSRPRYRGG